MSSEHQSHQPQRILVVVDREFRAHDADHARVLAAIEGHHAHVVTPARAVPGERWVVDLTARRRAAAERLDSWAAAMARHARTVAVDIGDARMSAALSDASASLRPDRVVVVAAAPEAARRGRDTGPVAARRTARLRALRPAPIL